MLKYKKNFRVLMLSQPKHWPDTLLQVFTGASHIQWGHDHSALLSLPGLWDLVVVDLDVLDSSFIKEVGKHTFFPIWTPFLVIGKTSQAHKLTLLSDLYLHKIIFRPFESNDLITSIRILLKEAKQKQVAEQKVILAIGSHPDDIEFGMGGSLALLKAQGHKIHFLVMSEGEVGGKAETRKKECEKAAKILSLESLNIKNLHDAHILDDLHTINLITEVVQEINPMYVFTHSLHDNHQDHRSVHLASVIACRQVYNVLCYQSPSATVDFRPTYFMEISPQIKTKLQLIACYKSQKKPYLNPKIVRSMAMYWGRNCSYGLAEAFEVIRMVH